MYVVFRTGESVKRHWLNTIERGLKKFVSKMEGIDEKDVKPGEDGRYDIGNDIEGAVAAVRAVPTFGLKEKKPKSYVKKSQDIVKRNANRARDKDVARQVSSNKIDEGDCVAGKVDSLCAADIVTGTANFGSDREADVLYRSKIAFKLACYLNA